MKMSDFNTDFRYVQWYYVGPGQYWKNQLVCIIKKYKTAFQGPNLKKEYFYLSY